MAKDTSYELDNWGMTIKSNNNTINIPWNEIFSYSELPGYFLITQTNNALNTHIISKNEFQNNEELKEFIHFLNEKRLKRI